MDLSCAWNQRLCQPCCHCPVAPHISHSQTPLGRERREDNSHRKAPEVTQNACAAWGSLLCAPSAEAPCSWMCRHTLPGGQPKSQLSFPSWDGFCPSQALHHPRVTTSSQTRLCASTPATDNGHRHHSALMQYSMLIHLENTWKDLNTCTIQASHWDSGNRNRPVITK